MERRSLREKRVTKVPRFHFLSFFFLTFNLDSSNDDKESNQAINARILLPTDSSSIAEGDNSTSERDGDGADSSSDAPRSKSAQREKRREEKKRLKEIELEEKRFSTEWNRRDMRIRSGSFRSMFVFFFCFFFVYQIDAPVLFPFSSSSLFLPFIPAFIESPLLIYSFSLLFLSYPFSHLRS